MSDSSGSLFYWEISLGIKSCWLSLVSRQFLVYMNNWLTEELKQEIRKTFEPRYKRELADEEIIEIASNLARFMEHVVKSSTRRNNGIIKKAQ